LRLLVDGAALIVPTGTAPTPHAARVLTQVITQSPDASADGAKL
jgi:hypothetical protein